LSLTVLAHAHAPLQARHHYASEAATEAELAAATYPTAPTLFPTCVQALCDAHVVRPNDALVQVRRSSLSSSQPPLATTECKRCTGAGATLVSGEHCSFSMTRFSHTVARLKPTSVKCNSTHHMYPLAYSHTHLHTYTYTYSYRCCHLL
jgi:hypothetical protein